MTKSRLLCWVWLNIVILLLVCFLASAGGCLGGPALNQGKVNPSSTTLRAWARLYMASGDYIKAQPFSEQALSLAMAGGVCDSELSLCLIDLAYLYRHQGRLGEAEDMCRLGLTMLERVYYKEHPYVASTLRILSDIYQDQGRLAEAEAALARSMAIMSKYHRSDDPVMGPFQVDVAKLLVAQGRFAKAEACYVQALVSINNSFGPDHLYTIGVLSDIARLHSQRARSPPP